MLSFTCHIILFYQSSFDEVDQTEQHCEEGKPKKKAKVTSGRRQKASKVIYVCFHVVFHSKGLVAEAQGSGSVYQASIVWKSMTKNPFFALNKSTMDTHEYSNLTETMKWLDQPAQIGPVLSKDSK